MTVDQWGRFPVSDTDDLDLVLSGLKHAWEMDLVTEDSSGFDCGMSFALTKAGREYLYGPKASFSHAIVNEVRSALARLMDAGVRKRRS